MKKKKKIFFCLQGIEFYVILICFLKEENLPVEREEHRQEYKEVEVKKQINMADKN